VRVVRVRVCSCACVRGTRAARAPHRGGTRGDCAPMPAGCPTRPASQGSAAAPARAEALAGTHALPEGSAYCEYSRPPGGVYVRSRTRPQRDHAHCSSVGPGADVAWGEPHQPRRRWDEGGGGFWRALPTAVGSTSSWFFASATAVSCEEREGRGQWSQRASGKTRRQTDGQPRKRGNKRTNKQTNNRASGKTNRQKPNKQTRKRGNKENPSRRGAVRDLCTGEPAPKRSAALACRPCGYVRRLNPQRARAREPPSKTNDRSGSIR
jgi:hypothetical protein